MSNNSMITPTTVSKTIKGAFDLFYHNIVSEMRQTEKNKHILDNLHCGYYVEPYDGSFSSIRNIYVSDFRQVLYGDSLRPSISLMLERCKGYNTDEWVKIPTVIDSCKGIVTIASSVSSIPLSVDIFKHNRTGFTILSSVRFIDRCFLAHPFKCGNSFDSEGKSIDEILNAITGQISDYLEIDIEKVREALESISD